jgi:hypothetical protein
LEDGGVTDWLCSAGSKVLAFFNLVPEVGEGLFWTPLAAEIFLIYFEILWSDNAIGGAEVSEDAKAGYIGETHSGIAEFGNVGFGYGLEELMHEGGFDEVGNLEVGKGGFVIAGGSLDLVLGCTLGNDGAISWVGRWDDGCNCSGEGHVGRSVRNKKEMAMSSGAEGAVNGTGIGINLILKEGDSGMVGDAADGAVEGSKDGFWEGSDGGGHGRVVGEEV